MVFDLRIKTDQCENDEEDIPVMQFQLAGQFVWGVCKETLQASEERIGLAFTDFTDEFLYFDGRFYLVYIGLKRCKLQYNPYSTFTIGEPKREKPELLL